MKLYKKIILFTPIFLLIIAFFLFVKFPKQTDINKLLLTNEYSYLSKEAQRFIRDTYEKTGEIILTEKNKEPDKPYLNPSFAEYLGMSEEEKNSLEVIPNVYSVDYTYDDKVKNSFSSSYDLRNVNGQNKTYLSPMKNQETLSVCWAISSVENAETFLMQQKGESYNSSSSIFSSRQLDYASSTNGLYYYDNYNGKKYIWSNEVDGSRTLTSGGNFFISSYTMANGLSLAKEESLPWSTSTTSYKPEEILNYSKSEYEVNSTIQIPNIIIGNNDTSLQNNYNNVIKDNILKYGGPYIGTISPMTSCGFKNTDGKYVLKTDECAETSTNRNQGHAMQIIGWDDNYSYEYCQNDDSHSASVNGKCSNGTYMQGKGAWILRNSWGDETPYKYVHLTYDSKNLDISFITSMSSMKERNWDNNYHNNIWENQNTMRITNNQEIEYNTHNSNPEKIEKIKFISYQANDSYTLSIITDNKTYNNIATVNLAYPGIYTFDLSDKNIILDDEKFKVKITSNNHAKFVYNSISVFTSNVKKEEQIAVYSEKAYDKTKPLSNDNPLYIKVTPYWGFTFNYYTKNIPANSNITYRLTKGDKIYDRFTNISPHYILDGYGKTEFMSTNTVTYLGENSFNIVNTGVGNTFNFEILKDNKVITSFPVKFNTETQNTKSNIKIYSNNGNDKFHTFEGSDKNYIDLSNFNYNNSTFFNNGYYITGWNTKPDGTGTSYSLTDKLYLYKDEELYIQWSKTLLNNKITYSCREECSGQTPSSVYKYGEKIKLATNAFSNTDYKFLYWSNTVDTKYYYEEETVSATNFNQYPVFNNKIINFNAVWSQNASTINFDANGGSGTMKSINVQNDVYSRLKTNLFTNPGYTFKEWNTKSDGTGTSYTGYIKTNSDMTLYAIWSRESKKIRLNANDGTSNSILTTISYNTDEKIQANSFTKTGYIFKNWNTKANGTGTSYQNETLTSNIPAFEGSILDLYAIWTPITYTISYNANGGSGTMSNQSIKYDETKRLSKNKFTNNDLFFIEWNTKADGTGTSFADEEEINNLTSTNNHTIELYAIWQEGQAYESTLYVIDEEKNYIDSIEDNTTLATFKNNLKLKPGYTLEIELNNKPYIYTGSITKIYKGNKVIKEFTNIVKGDINGDGKLTYLDYVGVYNHIFKVKNPLSSKKQLTNIYSYAADYNKDNKINYLDYVKIYKRIKEIKGGN